jgi:hypothetical protein
MGRLACCPYCGGAVTGPFALARGRVKLIVRHARGCSTRTVPAHRWDVTGRMVARLGSPADGEVDVRHKVA